MTLRRKIISNRWLWLLVLISMGFLVIKNWVGQQVSADTVAQVFFQSENISGGSVVNTSLKIDSGLTNVGFVEAEVVFDPLVIKIASGSSVTTNNLLSTVIELTQVEAANLNGHLNIVLALPPGDVASPSGLFELAKIPFEWQPGSNETNTTISLNQAALNIYDPEGTELSYLATPLIINRLPTASPSPSPTVSPIPSPSPSPSPSPLPSSQAQLKLNLTKTKYYTNEDVAIDLNLDTVTPITGVDAILIFNPRLLTITSIDNSKLLPNTPMVDFNNGDGTIKISQVANQGAPYLGSGKLATIHAVAHIAGEKTVYFDFAPDLTTDSNVIDAATGRDTLIKPQEVSFDVFERGSLKIKVIGPSTNHAFSGTLSYPEKDWSTAIITDASGMASMELPDGFVSTSGIVKLKIHGYLTSQKTITFADGENVVDFGKLIPGDLNDDDIVNTLDLALMYVDWFKVSAADYNKDGTVNAADHWYLIDNFFASL